MKKILTLLTGFTLFLLLAGCNGATDTAEEDSDVEEAVEGDAGAGAVTAAKEYEVNMFFQSDFAADYAGFDMMVNYIVDGWMYPKGAAGAAGVTPGMKLVLVNMTVMNPDSDMNAGPAMNDFSLMMNSTITKPVWFLAGSGREQFPNMMSVAPDAEMTADLLFEVPMDMDLSGAEFSFVNSLSTDGGTQFGLAEYM